MGIPIEQPEKIPAPGGCFRCFIAGETPRYLFVSVSEIARAQFWAPLYGDPPNGLFILEYHSGCLWRGTFGDWTSTYQAFAGSAIVTLNHTPSVKGFVGGKNEHCAAHFEIIPQLGLEFIFTSGWVLVAIQDDCPLVSLNQLAESVGLHPDNELFAEVFPKDNEEAVIRFAHKQDKTNVKILYDCS